jgi:DNA-binding LacI/PurR family transcriptional regulator
MRVTMREVAEAAGVSIATVSFVVNNTKPVMPETRQRIERAMAELGFRPNVVARALASRRTQILALVMPLSRLWLGAATREFIVGAARAAKEANHHLVIWPVGNDGNELVALVGQKLVDGVLLMSVALDDARVEALRKLDTPFTLIGRTRDVTGLHYVDVDIAASMRVAMDHLAELGHQQIAFVNGNRDEEGVAGFGPYVRSEHAYRELAGERGIDPVVLYCRSNVASGREAARELLTRAPRTTAVIILDEAGAAGLVAELKRLDRRVPDRISVLSMLGSADFAEMWDPPLTTISTPGTELGRLAVEALLRQLDGRPPMTGVLRTGLLVSGGTTGPVHVNAAKPRQARVRPAGS